MAHPLLEKAQSQGNPLIEGNQATFVWQGRETPRLIGDFSDWEDGKPERMSYLAPGLWTATLTFPLDAYIEYAILRHGAILQDPLNERLVDSGVGQANNYFYMPQAAVTPLAQAYRHIPHGMLTRHLVKTDELAVNPQRRVYLYHPPGTGPAPLLVVFDGYDYLRRASLPIILDNLIAQGRIRPLALAMVNNGASARTVEYMCNEATLLFITQRVLPLAVENLDLIDVTANPGAFGLMGSSLGGLMAVYGALRLPHIFGHVLSQSGAFSLFGYEQVVFPMVVDGPRQPVKLWLDAGQYEAELVATNRRMADLLRQRGYPLDYHEYAGGHNYSSWRNDLWRGLEFLFGN